MGRTTKEDYARHYRDYAGKPAAIAARSENNKARRVMEEKLGKAALKGKDVHHIKPQRAGGKTVASNLKVTGTAHRGWKGEK